MTIISNIEFCLQPEYQLLGENQYIFSNSLYQEATRGHTPLNLETKQEIGRYDIQEAENLTQYIQVGGQGSRGKGQ